MSRAGSAPRPSWRVWVDTGGTFTDCLAVDPEGELHRAKVLSSSALRVTLSSPIHGRRGRIAADLDLASGESPGWSALALGSGEPPAPMIAWDAAAGEILLNEERQWPQGATLELRSPEEAPLLAARIVTGTPAAGELPPLELRLATTLGTNALLERRGAATALFVTRGFADLLVIGDQRRPDLFALEIVKPEPLYRALVEVPERRDAEGRVVEPLDAEALRPQAEELLAAGITSAAVALLHAYRDPGHEEALAARLRAWGVAHVSTSAALAPVQGYLPRAETAVIDAYLAPIFEGYVGRIAEGMGAGVTPWPASSQGASEVEPARDAAALRLMTSAGGLVAAAAFRAKDGLLSGPAAGVAGALAAGARSRRQRLLTFDMGGTSTDVARCDGELPWVFQHRVGAARLLAPAVAVETVAAGGGSICWFDGHQVRVGPESGGARPGPACYGAGGPLCLTDVNLLLGRLDPSRFHLPLDLEAARAAFEALREQVAEAAGEAPGAEELLQGFRRIADERMAEAIREISVRQGYDPAGYALLAFGGAGPQHACAVAALLGVREVLVPPDAGLLSAVGLGAAVTQRFATREVLAPLEQVAGRVDEWLRELGKTACREVAAEGVSGDRISVARLLAHLRFQGQESAVEVEIAEGADLAASFRERYRELYGYLPEGPVELVSLRVVARESPEQARKMPSLPPQSPGQAREALPAPASSATSGQAGEMRPAGTVPSWVDSRWRRLPVYDRDALRPGVRARGPALVTEEHSTTVVEPGWRLLVDGAGTLVLEREAMM